MDENKMIRPMDFVRLTNIDESNVIKDTKNHIGLVKEVSRDGRMSIIWIGETYSQLAWFKSSELEVVDNLVSILTCGLANFRGDGKGRWWISKKAVMSWVPKGQTVDGSGWVISFTLSFGLDNGTQIKFYKEDEHLNEIDRLNELFNVIL